MEPVRLSQQLQEFFHTEKIIVDAGLESVTRLLQIVAEFFCGLAVPSLAIAGHRARRTSLAFSVAVARGESLVPPLPRRQSTFGPSIYAAYSARSPVEWDDRVSHGHPAAVCL
ncbi:MAG: hypothetical protein M1415_03405 [Firmicutes bacterium]|nr:hypothetical protein [Bacillota bacterium]